MSSTVLRQPPQGGDLRDQDDDQPRVESSPFKNRADSAVSYAPFLAAWSGARTFGEAVDAANAADVGSVNDTVFAPYYIARNLLVFASQVDSDRKRSGMGRTRIYSAS